MCNIRTYIIIRAPNGVYEINRSRIVRFLINVFFVISDTHFKFKSSPAIMQAAIVDIGIGMLLCINAMSTKKS